MSEHDGEGLHALYAHFTALHDRLDAIDRRAAMGRAGWLKHFIKDLEYNPATQYKVHLYAMYVWTASFITVIILFTFFRPFWLVVSVLYLVLISLYANWATDYGAMSAALAAQGRPPLPEVPMEPPGALQHYQQQDELRELLRAIKAGTDLLEEIHAHVSVLSPHAGKFDPDGTPTAPGRKPRAAAAKPSGGSSSA